MNPPALRPGAALAAALLLTPAARALDVFLVCDNAADRVWRVADLNLDGDYDDPGELTLFYDDTALGAHPLSTNSGLKIGPGGIVYVGDLGEDVLLRLEDLNADGDAHDAGEWTVFFDGDPTMNLSGITLNSSNNFVIDAAGVFWAANAATSTTGSDAIVRIEDVNLDGDANDAGEALMYFQTDHFGAGGSGLPQAVAIGPDGRVYYAETGTAAAFPKGIYRLDDIDLSGVIDQAAEFSAYFLPPPLGGTATHFNLRVDAGGRFYLGDTGNDVIWRAFDADASGAIDVPGENAIFWAAGGSSLVWDFTFGFDGSLLVCESQAPDRLLRMVDADASGAIDPGEVSTVYEDTVSGTDIGDPRAIEFLSRPHIDGQAMCAGDGLDPDVTTPCPCGNTGAAGNGCANSVNAAGARLDVAGSTSPDQLALLGSGMPATVSCIYLQGDALDDIVFGDGVRCAGGQLIRLRTKQNAGGASQFPDSADTVTVSQRGMVVPGSADTRWYQTYYRNAAAAFCPPATFNVTNGWRITW